jgi:Phage integrase, N-terminal SAM-like domain
LRKSFDTILGVSPSTAAVASSPKLLDRVRWHLRAKHYSIRTEQAYVDWIRRYILFHRKRHPNEMGEKEINRLPHSSRGRKECRRFCPESGVLRAAFPLSASITTKTRFH